MVPVSSIGNSGASIGVGASDSALSLSPHEANEGRRSLDPGTLIRLERGTGAVRPVGLPRDGRVRRIECVGSPASDAPFHVQPEWRCPLGALLELSPRLHRTARSFTVVAGDSVTDVLGARTACGLGPSAPAEAFEACGDGTCGSRPRRLRRAPPGLGREPTP
jgi:hypothetical protein